VREKLHRVDNLAASDALNVKEVYVLLSIGTQGAMTMSAIARALQMTLSGVTTVIDKLEAKQLVSRVRSTSDRRIVNVELTKRGRSSYALLERGHLKLTKACSRCSTNASRCSCLSCSARLQTG
jgi:DNA-binding MarR family transcriptional regulator